MILSLPDKDFILGHVSQCDVGLELPRIGGPSTRDLAERYPERFADIYGGVLTEVLPHVGWKNHGSSSLVLAVRDGQCVGAGWASAVVRRIDKAKGTNLTYVVDPSVEGKGLGSVLASIAFLRLDSLPGSSQRFSSMYVGIQTRAGNAASCGLARSMGFQQEDKLTFSCETSAGPLDYAGFSMPADQFDEKARALVAQRVQGWWLTDLGFEQVSDQERGEQESLVRREACAP